MTAADVLDLIKSLASSLAWPLFIFWAVWLIREPLKKLISRIDTIKYKDLEMTVNSDMENIGERAEALEPETSDFQAEILGTFDEDPQITVIKSWASVEDSIERLLNKMRPQLGWSGRMYTTKGIHILRHANIIEPELASLLLDMRAVRNLVAHGRETNLLDHNVRRYVEAATRVASIVDERQSEAV